MSNITIYTTNSCPWCVKAKKYLSSIGIEYKEINVSKDIFGAMEMVRKSGQRGVPVIEVNGHIIIGFDKSKLDNLLKK